MDSDRSKLGDFAERLRAAIGDESVNAFGKRCGVIESKVRSYLKGSVPSVDTASALAKGAGVRLEWLATGEGPMRPGEAAPAPPTPEAVTPPDTALDHDLAGEVCASIYELYRAEGVRWPMAKIMSIAMEYYEGIVAASDTLEGRRGALNYVLTQIRKDLRSGASATPKGNRTAGGS